MARSCWGILVQTKSARQKNKWVDGLTNIIILRSCSWWTKHSISTTVWISWDYLAVGISEYLKIISTYIISLVLACVKHFKIRQTASHISLRGKHCYLWDDQNSPVFGCRQARTSWESTPGTRRGQNFQISWIIDVPGMTLCLILKLFKIHGIVCISDYHLCSKWMNVISKQWTVRNCVTKGQQTF